MFRKQDIDVYRSITAPDSLKDKVLLLQQPTKIKPWYQRYAGAIAACVAVVFLLSSVLVMDRTSPTTALLVHGATIGSSPVEVSQMTSTAKIAPSSPREDSFTAVLECKVSGDTTITVSGGSIYEQKAPQNPADILSVSKNTSLCWSVESEEHATSYQMTISSPDSVNTYVLQQNKENGVWTIFQQ